VKPALAAEKGIRRLTPVVEEKEDGASELLVLERSDGYVFSFVRICFLFD